jgi:sulfatase maturation enzyme AslB (radical SAM superfamily)
MIPALDRISLELSRRCSKGCSFCYNGSHPEGSSQWTAAEVVAFAEDCAQHGVKAVSFGGGEPLECPEVFAILESLTGVMFRSLTTNGLPLPELFDALVKARPDKVHVSIHFPGNAAEVRRVIGQVNALDQAGLRSGVNLLVRASGLAAARNAAQELQAAGIGNDRIVYLPMRGQDTPTPQDLASVAGERFQSMTCLSACGRSPRFASIDSEKRAAWCSYTTTRRRIETPTWAGLVQALDGLGLAPCG